MHRLLPLLLLALLSGCVQLGNLRIADDGPQDLDLLLQNHEYARARLLTGRHPAIDTVDVQSTIAALETEYESSVYKRARELEADQNLIDAVGLLTDALQKIPHSSLLRALRTDLEEQRTRQVRINERDMQMVRAEYLIDQLELYQQQIKLKPPGFMQKREYAHQQAESMQLAEQLIGHADYTLQQGDTDTARRCLQLSMQLQASDTASAKLAAIQAREEQAMRAREQAASARQEVKRRTRTRNDAAATRQLLHDSQQALQQNNLQDAQAALAKIPPSTSKDSAVVEAHDSVVQAVNVRVSELMTAGDARYRAEDIITALRSWTEALSLDPDNKEILKRIDRANKVLANLDELRRQQQK